MDPYRESASPRCPTCGDDGLLRVHDGRTYCDECGGVLMTVADFRDACNELRGVEVPIALSDEEPQRDRCPSCQQAMTRVRVDIGPKKARALVLRCAKDGLWFPRKELSYLFARVSLGMHPRSAHGHDSGGSGNVAGTDGITLPGTARGPATAGLRIGQWYLHKRKSPRITPINIYADRTLACPSCSGELAFQGDRWSCLACPGTFLQNDVLEGLVLDVSGGQWKLPPALGTAGPRACPVCGKAMLVEDLEHVPIDRCTAHGLWFDSNELTIMLERASGQFEAHGVRAWLHRLFA